MSFYALFVTYIITWWLVLFMVLPFGIRSQAEEGQIVKGTEHGSPIAPNLLRKFMITTGISFIIWAIICVSFTNEWITLDNLPFYRPEPYNNL